MPRFVDAYGRLPWNEQKLWYDWHVAFAATLLRRTRSHRRYMCRADDLVNMTAAKCLHGHGAYTWREGEDFKRYFIRCMVATLKADTEIHAAQKRGFDNDAYDDIAERADVLADPGASADAVVGFSTRLIARRISTRTSRTARSSHDAGSPCSTMADRAAW